MLVVLSSISFLYRQSAEVPFSYFFPSESLLNLSRHPAVWRRSSRGWSSSNLDWLQWRWQPSLPCATFSTSPSPFLLQPLPLPSSSQLIALFKSKWAVNPVLTGDTTDRHWGKTEQYGLFLLEPRIREGCNVSKVAHIFRQWATCATANDACSNHVLMMHMNISAAFHHANNWSEPPTVDAAFPPHTQLLRSCGLTLNLLESR